MALQARKEAIEERLQQIRASSPGSLIRQLWQEHHGVMCAGVYWDRYGRAPLLRAGQMQGFLRCWFIIQTWRCLCDCARCHNLGWCGVWGKRQQRDVPCCAGLDMLAEIAECIGGHSLASICRLLAEDHSGWSGQPLHAILQSRNHWVGIGGLHGMRQLLAEGLSSAALIGIPQGDHDQWNAGPARRHIDCPHGVGAGGMPDLLLWNAERREAKLSEVKGPRDRLSEQQRAWAGALAAGGLHIEVR